MSSQSRKPDADGQPAEKREKPASPGRYSLSTENSTDVVGVRIDSTRIPAVRAPDSKNKDAVPRQTMQMTSDAPPAPSGGAAAALAAAVPPPPLPQGAPPTVRGPGLPPPRHPPALPNAVSRGTKKMNVTPQGPPPVPTATVRMSQPEPSQAKPPPPPEKNPRATTLEQPVQPKPKPAAVRVVGVGESPKASPLASSLPPAPTDHASEESAAFAPTPLAAPVVVITPIEAPPPVQLFVPANPGQETMIVSAGEPAEKSPTAPPLSPRSMRPFTKPPSGFPMFDEGSVAHAFDALMAEGPAGEGTLQTFDLAPVRELFAQLAASHMRHVRDFMLDVKWGEATREWIEICVPACVSLRRASERLDLQDLTAGLDVFAAALKHAGNGVGLTIDGEPKHRLIDAYTKLSEILPQAFALDTDKSEREAVIVQALLLQIPDVRKVTIDKLHAAGLTNLKTLWEATPFEIAQVSGITEALATRIVERFEEYRRELRESRPSDARAAEREKLAELLGMLKSQHDGYEEAARGWSSDAKAKKRDLFRAREETWLAISLLLARFGEVERLAGIEKVPYAQRIAQLEGWLGEAAEKYRLDA
jgi:hypothetical protein